MWQRIQTVWLLLVIVIIAAFLFTPVYGEADGVVKGIDSPLLMGLAIVLAGIAFVTIVLFKNRKLQIRLCQINLLLFAALVGLTTYFFVTGEPVGFTVGVLFPVLGGIFTILALRGIRKDEKLVQSYDRLR